MAIIFSPFIKEMLSYATSIAELYEHGEVTPTHFMLSLLKHHKNSVATAYIESKIHLVRLVGKLITELAYLPTASASPILNDTMEIVLRNGYDEAKDFNSAIILPEYFFLALLKITTFEALDYGEARAFIASKMQLLQSQHEEINWTKQEALFQLLKKLDKLYVDKQIKLKPYLHQACHALTNEIRSFILLIDETTQMNKITLEIIENDALQEAIAQTLRFVSHRKYPLEEAFLYHYDTNDWTKIKINPKDIIIDTENNHYSEVLALSLR